MRKIAFFVMILFSGFMLNNTSWANCRVLSCNDADGINGWVRINGNQCFFCGPGSKSCSSGDIVASLNDKGEVTKLWQCSMGWTNEFVDYSTSTICSNSPIQKNNVKNTSFVYSLNGGKSLKGYQAGAALINVGTGSCRYITCNSGFSPASDKMSCVKTNNNCPLSGGSKAIIGHVINKNICNPTNASTGLKSTAHVKTGQVCTVECVSGGWNVTLNSDACETDYEPSADKKECVMTAAAKQRQQQQQQQQQQQKEKEEKERKRRENATNKELCEDSGGKWTGGTCKCDVSKNLKKEGKECVCLNDTDYKWDEASKSCKITNEAALRKACESAAATGAYMEDGKCKCQDRDKIWKGDKCIDNTDIKQCKSAGGAKWDYQKNECVCNDSNMEYDSGNNKCVETKEAREKRIKNAEREASREKIADIRNKLNQLKAGLGTSVWKDREGNFNTARLASDSIAGVVLGTAGGLITSNVIKKNQIKGGFEDINCTIGGQTVAGFGDEFQVGIR